MTGLGLVPAPPEPALGTGLDQGDLAHVLGWQTRVLGLLASGAPLSGLLEAISLALEELIPGSRTSILLLDRDGRTLHHGAAPHLPREYSLAIDGIQVGPAAGSCGTAAYLGKRVVAVDLRTDDRWVSFRALALPHGLRSCWSTPIIGSDGHAVGTFAVYHDEPHEPTPREEEAVDHFTYLASVAVSHAALFGAVAESEEKFRRAFDDNAVGMALVDVDGRTLRVNPALARLLGRDHRDIVGGLFETWLDDPSAMRWRRWFHTLVGHVEGVASRSDSTQLRVTLTRPPAEVVAEVTASSVRAATGELLYVCLNVLDVTEQLAAAAERRARREAEVAQATAEAHNTAKSELLTTVSHELRSPLQAVIGFTELLSSLDLDRERRQEALTHIDAGARHVLALVDDVLDIARLDAHVLPLRPRDVLLSPVVHEVVTLLGPLADRRQVRLVVADVQGATYADPRRLRQVLINLVTNGIQYTGGGGAVTVGTAAGTAGFVLLRVEDNGKGIPAAMLGRLFTPFDRLDQAPGGPDGIGLGLRVARGLTEAMGGRLDISSAVGRGTTADVELPVATGRDAATGPA